MGSPTMVRTGGLYMEVVFVAGSTVYSATCLVSTLKGPPNLYFLSEVLAISTG